MFNMISKLIAAAVLAVSLLGRCLILTEIKELTVAV